MKDGGLTRVNTVTATDAAMNGAQPRVLLHALDIDFEYILALPHDSATLTAIRLYVRATTIPEGGCRVSGGQIADGIQGRGVMDVDR